MLQTTLPDIIPDLGPALASKNPQVKEGTLKFLGRCLSRATTPIQPPQVKPLSETLATLLEDSVDGVRIEGAVCMGTLMKMVGERPMTAVLDGLADIRKAKVKEAFEKATVKCKAGGAAPPLPKPAAPPAAAPKKKAPAAAKPLPEDETPPPPKKVAAKPPPKIAVRFILFLPSHIRILIATLCVCRPRKPPLLPHLQRRPLQPLVRSLRKAVLLQQPQER